MVKKRWCRKLLAHRLTFMQRFVSSNGFVEINYGTLFVKTVKIHFWDAAVGQYLYALLLPVWLVISIISWSDSDKGNLVIVALLTVIHANKVFEILFKKSFATRIPLHRIKDWKVVDLPGNDLEQQLVLHLRNGRKRHISFRKREDGLTGLEAALKSEQQYNPQLGAKLNADLQVN